MNKKTMLVLEVGESRVVLAEFLRGRLEWPTLLKYKIADISQDTDLVTCIRAMAEDMQVNPKDIYLLSFPASISWSRFIKLPPVTPDRMHNIVRYEAEQNIPFPLDEVVWDSQMVEICKSRYDKEVHTLLIGAKKRSVELITDALAELGSYPFFVETSSMSLVSSVAKVLPVDNGGTSLVIDVRERETNLVFVEGDDANGITKCHFKTIHRGAGDPEIKKEIKDTSFRGPGSSFAMGFGATASGVFRQGLGTFDEDLKLAELVDLDSAPDAKAKFFAAEIKRSINYCRSSVPMDAPSRVFLTGDFAKIQHFEEEVGKVAKAPIQELQVASSLAKRENLPDLDNDLPHLNVVCGLAMRPNYGSGWIANLLPDSVVKNRKSKRLKRLMFRYVIPIAASLIVSIGGWFVFNFIAHY